MPWTRNRLEATFCAAEADAIPSLLLPIYGYHDCIYSITWEDFQRNLRPEQDPYAGYTRLEQAAPQSEVTYRDYQAGTDAYWENLSYLKKIDRFCQQEGIQLILYIAPSFARIPPDALAQLKADLGEISYCAFYDCNDGSWPALDRQTAWYDFLHYNVYGALPFSRAMGLRLEQLGLRVTEENTALWQQRLEALEAAQPPAP